MCGLSYHLNAFDLCRVREFTWGMRVEGFVDFDLDLGLWGSRSVGKTYSHNPGLEHEG